MSVNLPRPYRVIAIAIIVGVAISTLAWSGDHRLLPASHADTDTIPSHHPRKDRKASKPSVKQPEGRVARELDLRVDAEEPEFLLDGDALGDMDVHFDLEDLKGLNARIEADVLKNIDALKDMQDTKELDAMKELDRISICDEDLEELKDLDISEDIWNELRDLKMEMDELREEIDNDVSGRLDDDRVREEVRRVMEAVQREIPRVRKEVEKALASHRDDWQSKWQ